MRRTKERPIAEHALLCVGFFVFCFFCGGCPCLNVQLLRPGLSVCLVSDELSSCSVIRCESSLVPPLHFHHRHTAEMRSGAFPGISSDTKQAIIETYVRELRLTHSQREVSLQVSPLHHYFLPKVYCKTAECVSFV